MLPMMEPVLRSMLVGDSLSVPERRNVADRLFRALV